MKSPIAKTLFMGLVAVVTSIVAAAYYPWPEPVAESELVGQPLLEPFEANSVRSISIAKFDTNRNQLERIELKRRGEKWLIPAHQNYVADNIGQISLAVNALNGNVLETRSDNQQDHVEYEVVDPLEFESTPNRTSLGTKITLKDRHQRELGSLIVGARVRDETQQNLRKRFVRLAGQPHVYVMEIEPRALQTQFTDWVSLNLLRLTEDLPVHSIQIQNYRRPDATVIANDTETGEDDDAGTKNSAAIAKQWHYRATFELESQAKPKLEVPAEDRKGLKTVDPTDLQIQQFSRMGAFLGRLPFADVQRKPDVVAQALRKSANIEDSVAEELEKFGILPAIADEPKQDQKQSSDSNNEQAPTAAFDAVAGEVVVTTADGVSISLLFGSLAENSSSTDLSLSHHLMLFANVDESVIPEVEKPNTEDEAMTESQQKSYLRKVAERDKKLAAARQRANELNQLYADWFYIVSETAIADIRPELDLESEPVAE